ncbi:hypothetical protein GIB67_028037, partial [Kingdonia uniflora]
EYAFEKAHTFQPSISNTDQENETYGLRRDVVKVDAQVHYLCYRYLPSGSPINLPKMDICFQVTDRMMLNARHIFSHNNPTTKEAYFYRTIFERFFPQNSAKLIVLGGASMASSAAKEVEWNSACSNNLDPSDKISLGVHDSAYEAQVPVAAMANAKIPSPIVNNDPRMVSAPTVASSFGHLRQHAFINYMGVVFLLVIIFPRQLQEFHGSVEDLRCKGFHSSFRTVNSGLSLNIDLSTTMIVQPDIVVNILLVNQGVKSP